MAFLKNPGCSPEPCAGHLQPHSVILSEAKDLGFNAG